MSDLIRRSDAIKAVNDLSKEPYFMHQDNDCWTCGVIDARNAITNVKSAEVPNRVQIIRKEIERLCENCERPTEEETKEKTLELMAVGFSFGLNADRPRGEWIGYDSMKDKFDDIRCSCCQRLFTVDAYHFTDIGFTKDDLKFCPNCGAQMKGADDE